MHWLGVRTAQGDWTWVLRGADGAAVAHSTRSFGSEAQALSDAAVVRKQLQSARIESADFLPIAPLRTAQGDR